jgi:hypothetical protein
MSSLLPPAKAPRKPRRPKAPPLPLPPPPPFRSGWALGIDPGREGAAVVIHVKDGKPSLQYAFAWRPSTRAKIEGYAMLAWNNGQRCLTAATWHHTPAALGAYLTARTGIGDDDRAACEAQWAGRHPGAGLALSRWSGLLVGALEVTAKARPLDWPTPSEWRAPVRAQLAHLTGAAASKAPGKGDPQALAALVGGWPAGIGACLGGTDDAPPEHVAEALGVALWAAMT